MLEGTWNATHTRDSLVCHQKANITAWDECQSSSLCKDLLDEYNYYQLILKYKQDTPAQGSIILDAA